LDRGLPQESRLLKEDLHSGMRPLQCTPHQLMVAQRQGPRRGVQGPSVMRLRSFGGAAEILELRAPEVLALRVEGPWPPTSLTTSTWPLDMAPIRRYLRITKYSVLEVRIYLENPAHSETWLLRRNDPALPRLIESVRPLVLPKLREENERARGNKKSKKNIKDVVIRGGFACEWGGGFGSTTVLNADASLR
jgi:hypothetical protein